MCELLGAVLQAHALSSQHERAMSPSLHAVQAAAAGSRRSGAPEHDWQCAVGLTYV